MHEFDVKDSSYDINNELQEVNIDVNGVLRGVHYFLPQLLKKSSGGTIMNVSSGLALVPFPGAPVYSATKAFVHSYTTSLRIQLANTNVKVVELLPPGVETPMTDGPIRDRAKEAGFTLMPVDEFVAVVRAELNANKEEIFPGDSYSMSIMARVAPSFLLGQMSKDIN